MDKPTESDLHTQTSHPLVSVLMPVYNALPWISESLDSVLCQSFEAFELICVDDGSTDGTASILDKYANRDPRIKILRRPNTGIVGALNDGLEIAQCELVARIDADDIMEPNRLQLQYDYMQQNPQYLALGGNLHQTDPYGLIVSTSNYLSDSEAIAAGVWRGEAPVVHGTLMYRKAAVLKVGGYRSKYEYIEDKDLYLRLIQEGPLMNLQNILVRVRQHPGSICSTQIDTQHHRTQQMLKEAMIKYKHASETEAIAHADKCVRATQRDMKKIYESWILHALKQERRDIARIHVKAMIHKYPLSIKTWRLFKWCYWS